MYCFHCMEKTDDGSSFCQNCGQPPYDGALLHHLAPGTLLNGKYLVGKVLGEGGFGITYIGRDLNLDMKIAIKEYYPNGYANRNHAATNNITISARSEDEFYAMEKKRFLTEARTLAKFSHDVNIVNVRDFFELNNTAYIIMEYLSGADLKHYLKANGKQEPTELVQWFIPILKVLGKVHNQGLVHRDISPDNIIVENGQLILIDFGAARDVNTNKSLSVILKPGYAPGEQYYSRGNQGPWTDIYAICATMYKCITGVTPPESSERVFEDKLIPPSAMGIIIPSYIEAALIKGMSNRYQERQPNMETLIAELTSPSSVSISLRSAEEEASSPVTVHVSTEDNHADPQYDMPADDESDEKTYYDKAAHALEADFPIPPAPDEDDEEDRTRYEPQAGASEPVDNPPPAASPVPDPPSDPPEPSPSSEPETPPAEDESSVSGIPDTPVISKGSVNKPDRLPIIVFSACGVLVLILILVFALMRGGSDNNAAKPSSTEVLSSISADGDFKEMITSFEIIEWKTNSSGSTCTALCAVATEQSDFTVSVIYELADDAWECTQVIVKENTD